MAAKDHIELGTAEVHKRHSVMIEGGPVPRAKVMDQAVVDRYLMEGKLTLAQHQAAELILELASKAGLFAKAPDPDKPRGGGTKGHVPAGIFSLARTLKTVTRRYGSYHTYLVQEVVCHNWDISDSPNKMKALTESLQAISDHRMSGGKNPARHLKKRGR